MSNLYHILHYLPTTEKWGMDEEKERLAEQLVKSGRFRIDANDKCNFVRFSLPQHNLHTMISYRELNDPELIGNTKKLIASSYARGMAGAQLTQKVNSEIVRLIYDMKKNLFVDFELEMKLARLITQSVHPVVMMMLLFERVEIYVSYSYNIGDMLDMQSWQQNGSNSGMQSTDGRKAAVFVSAGGDPIADTEKDATFGDGWPAIARMVIIGSQEMGHYSDIMRDRFGRQISRYSADFGGRRAKEGVRMARLKDMANINNLNRKLVNIGLSELVELEGQLRFFKKNKRNDWMVYNIRFNTYLKKKKFIKECAKLYMSFIPALTKQKNLATMILDMLKDMAFNLNPQAAVYSSSDPQEEEAIKCIEALARVPQQMAKWGHPIVEFTTPHLYYVYYNEVIPGCMIAYKNMSGQEYVSHPVRLINKPIWLRLKGIFIKKAKLPKFY